jgi:hypothetical protein
MNPKLKKAIQTVWERMLTHCSSKQARIALKIFGVWSANKVNKNSSPSPRAILRWPHWCGSAGRAHARPIGTPVNTKTTGRHHPGDKLEGASEWQIFWRIGIPLMQTGLMTVALLCFVGAWNNFFLPLIVLNQDSLYPLTLGLNVWNSVSSNAGGKPVYNGSGANFKKGRRADPGALGERESLACQIGPKFKLCTRSLGGIFAADRPCLR